MSEYECDGFEQNILKDKIYHREMKMENLMSDLEEKISPKFFFTQNISDKECSEINSRKLGNLKWMCPVVEPPSRDEIPEPKSAKKRDEIVCYSTSKNREWKLNVNEFNTKFKSNRNDHVNLRCSQKCWFTPAIPFPSINLKRTRKRKR